MKDKNGIEVKCKNCSFYNGKFCEIRETFPECHKKDYFSPTVEAYIARIAELQKEIGIIQESECAEAQEADKLRAEAKELGKKLTETIKLLSEQSRECGKLEACNEVLQRRVEEFSVAFLEQNMRDNKDVLERLKNAESEEKERSKNA